MIKFACSNCGQSIRVDDKHAGKRGRCPQCGTAVEVPERSSIITFHCGSCGAKIKVPDRHAGRKGKCPKCQETVVVPAAEQGPVEESRARTVTCSTCGVASESETPAPSETEGELNKEPAAAPATSGRPNRRLLILVAGALVVVAGVIGLVVFLRSAGSASVRESPVPRRRPDVAEAESPVEPVAAEVSTSEQIASPETVSPPMPEAVHLQFRPSPGSKQTLRVTTRLDISSQEGEQQVDFGNVQSFTVALEAKETQPDGTIPITVTLSAIEVKTEMQGTMLGEYDSAKPQSENDSMAGIYVPFVGKRFMVRASGQGELLDPGLDELFLAVAADRVAAEDDMMREQLKERAAAAIAKTDQHYGSRRSRTLALKQQFEESLILGADEVRHLLDHLLVPLPPESVQTGSRWDGPIAIRLEARFEIPGTYTVTALEEDSCTIVAEGQRNMEEEPFIYQVGTTTVSNKLGGSSQVNLTVDRPTGWLLTKEQKTTLSGRVLRTTAPAPGQETFSDVAMEITTTVTPIE